MDVCEVCGAFGYRHLLVQCNNCKNSTRHRYCMNPVLYDGSSIEWLCEDCPPKHNEVVESLKWRGDDHHSIQSSLGSSIIDEPNVNRVEVTKESWSWGCRRHRSHKARRYSTWGHRRHRSRKARRESTDAWTEHFPFGHTLNSSQMFVEENSKLNDVEKEGESGNDHIICDVARSHPFVMDDSCLTVPIVEQEDGSSHPLESAEQPYPLEVVSPDVSSHSPSSSALEIEEQGTEAGLFASVNDVEQSHLSSTDKTTTTLSSEEHGDGSSPTLESWEQPYPLEVVEPLDDAPNTILGWKPSSNNSQLVQSSDLDVGNMDVLVPSECLDPRSISKIVAPSSYSNGGDSAVEKDQAERTEFLSSTKTVTPALDNVQESSLSAEPTSSSNGGGDSAGEKNSAERTGRLSGMETVTPALDNVQGSSTSTAKECLVSNVDNSDEANRSNKHFLCTTENEESQLEVLSHPNILSGKVHCSHDGLNESSDPKSGPKGRDTQNDVRRASVSAGKNVVCSQESQREDVNSEALPSKKINPCKAKQSSFKKQENRDIQHTKDQKTKLIMKDRNADPAQLKSRLSKQLDDSCLDASSELSSKTKEVNDDNDAEPRCSTSAETFGNVVPMKRKRLSLPYGEDAEAMQAEVSNPPSSENDGQARMNRRYVESGAMNQGRSAENHEEVIYPGNSNNQHVNKHTQRKKQRRANKDKKAPLRNPSVRCAPDDADQLASEAAVAEGHCSLSKMPVSAPTDQQHFICTQPIDKPYWTGIMKIGQEYISLAAHLSNEACKKVHELSRSLPPVMKVTMHSKSKAWPSRFEASEFTAESIGLYFFSDNVRPNKDLDRLVQHVTDHSIVLKYVFGLFKLLICPSALLPEQSQMFQGKHYLWGVFRRRGTSKVAAQVKQKISASHAAEREKHQDKVRGGTQDQEMPPPKGTMPSENPPSPDTVHDREMPLPNGTMPSLGTVNDVGTETDPSEHRFKVRGGTQDQEMPVSRDTMPSENPPSPDTVHDQEMPLPKGTMPSENQPVPGTVHDVGTETDPGEHRNSHRNPEAPPTKLIGLVVARTPRAEQFIKDLENEGALVFAVKGLVKPGTVRHQAPSNAVGSEPTRDNRTPASEA